MNFSKLEEIYKLAREAGIGFSLTYEESSDTWYCTTDSFVGKSTSLETALESLKSFIESMIAIHEL